MINFASEERPIRCSQFQQILTCPMKIIYEDSSGVAADTGTATHILIAEWYSNGGDQKLAFDALITRKEKECPLAIIEEAVAMFQSYCRDPQHKEKPFAVEKKIIFRIPPHTTDTTQKEIVIRGTIDQLRKEGGVLRVYDIKTSKRDGITLLAAHQYQIALYCIAAMSEYKELVLPGGLILTRNYLKASNRNVISPLGTVFPFMFTSELYPHILSTVQLTVANIRNGTIYNNPGDYCNFCAGHHRCNQDLIQLRTKK